MSNTITQGTVSPYDLPPDWDAKTPEEKDRWFKQERARRLANRVQSEAMVREREKIVNRCERIAEANPAFAKVER